MNGGRTITVHMNNCKLAPHRSQHLNFNDPEPDINNEQEEVTVVLIANINSDSLLLTPGTLSLMTLTMTGRLTNHTTLLIHTLILLHSNLRRILILKPLALR